MKRVNFLCLAVLGLFFASCHSNDDTWGDWSRATSFKGLNRTGAVTFTIGDIVYVGLGVNKEKVNDADKTLRDFWKFERGVWFKVDSFPAAAQGRTGAVAFVIGNKAYVGTGFRDSYTTNDKKQYFSDFYEFDPSRPAGSQWSTSPALPKFPGEGRADAVAFSLNGKGYVGTGVADGGTALGDFYCYDPANSAWEDISFKGDARCGAVAFVLDGKAVVCLGAKSSNGSSNYVFDVNVYDPTTKTWIGKEPLVDRDGQGWDNDYNKIPRAYAIAFTSSLTDGTMRGYIATGSGSYARTCWEYNIQTDRWDEVTELPSAMQSRAYAVGFSLNNYGYLTTGGTSSGTAIDTDTWKFTPGIDEDDDNDYAPGD